MLEPYLEFKEDLWELEKVLKNLEEKENELKKFRGIRGLPEDIWDEVVEERKISGSGSNVDGVRFEIPPERIIPRKGTLTLEEAERFADLQVSILNYRPKSFSSCEIEPTTLIPLARSYFTLSDQRHATAIDLYRFDQEKNQEIKRRIDFDYEIE